MEMVLGLIVLVVVICAIAGSGSTTPPAPSPPSVRRPGPATPVRRAPPARPAPVDRELERRRLADEAFVDGVLFSHYFLEGRSEPSAAGIWDDGFDDEDYDDGMFD